MSKKLFIIGIGIMVLLIYLLNIGAFTEDRSFPDELKQVIKNTEDNYWLCDIGQSSIVLLDNDKKNQISISVSVTKDIFDDKMNLSNFKNIITRVSIDDSRYNDQVKSWMKLDGENLLGPKMRETTPYTAYNIKDYFDSTKNETAVALDKIHSYEKQEESLFEDWITYRAKYDLEGAEGGLPFSPDAYQGDLILLINENNTKMREIYISGDEWVYIRHLEKGEYPREINDDDLDDILENMWWTWEEILQPVVEKAESKIE